MAHSPISRGKARVHARRQDHDELKWLLAAFMLHSVMRASHARSRAIGGKQTLLFVASRRRAYGHTACSAGGIQPLRSGGQRRLCTVALATSSTITSPA